MALLLLAVMPLVLCSPAPLDKFPHPYVAHPPPDHGPDHHPEHGPGHLPAAPHPPPGHGPGHHPEEHKLPRKCHTEYVSVISKVNSNGDKFAG